MDKKEIRKHFSAIRKSVHGVERDEEILKRLFLFDKFINADIVLMYASYKSEPDTWLLLSQCNVRHIKTAFPKCNDNGTMNFYIVNGSAELSKGKYGISEPLENPDNMPEITEKTVCIVPGLAFTEHGERLGYGGGFYDRFLSENPHIYTIALAYEKCIAESLPTEKHDIKVKSIITEERTIICNE